MQSLKNTLCGTPVYLSPQLWEAYVKRQNFGIKHDLEKSDIFSLGLTFLSAYFLLTNEIAGMNDKGGEKIIETYLNKITNTKIRSLIAKMLIFDENQRYNYE